MIIIGGTYDEFCFEPRWHETYGSGLRACWVVSKLLPTEKIEFHTFGDQRTEKLLSYVECDIPNLKFSVGKIPQRIAFEYTHPLSTPAIYPRPDVLNKSNNRIEVEGENILYYGFIEGSASVKGQRVVYDPQSPVHPTAFSDTGSKAEHLAIVINLTEAKKMIGNNNADINTIKNYFFETEKAEVVILKMGAKGALVLTPEGEVTIPVYKTKSVWPLGSGDVFAASFATEWLNGADPIVAAKNASWNTANYCNDRGSFEFTPFESVTEITPLNISEIPKGTVYLAGPFFTFTQRWLVDEIRRAFRSMHLDVFSPWHDVGRGVAKDVVPADIAGIEKSKLIFSIIDGLDTGTVFEAGFATAKKLPVIAYVQNESEENLKMLEGTGAVLESDLTTAVYKTLWLLAEHE